MYVVVGHLLSFCSAVELFIKHKPSWVNLAKDDGYTPLHLAALNNHLEVLTTMLDSVGSEKNCAVFFGGKWKS